MYRILIVLVAGAVTALRGQQPGCSNIPDSTSIQPVGAFSNMRFTEEHAYGYVVELWKAGSCLFGLFAASEGLSGDTPTGLLKPGRYDPATGRLAFAARLTMGVTRPRNGTDWAGVHASGGHFRRVAQTGGSDPPGARPEVVIRLFR